MFPGMSSSGVLILFVDSRPGLSCFSCEFADESMSEAAGPIAAPTNTVSLMRNVAPVTNLSQNIALRERPQSIMNPTDTHTHKTPTSK